MTKQPDHVPQSPYPQLRDTALHGNAPVVANYADAEDVLHKVQQARHLLETNLSTILRSKQEGEVYNLINELTRDR